MIMKYIGITILSFAPIFALAAQPKDFRSLVTMITGIISFLVPLVFTLALIVVMWGVAKAWIINAGDETEINNGKSIAIAGVIGLVVMSGIWGILAILRAGIFGL